MGQLFNNILFIPILNVLLLLYKIFLTIHLPGAFGFSIIGLTVLIRLIFQPFFKQQMETAKKMQEMKPHLDRLNEKHKNDQKTLQQEQLKLYQQYGINPASGCLFMIIQIPIFIALYQVLYEPFKHGSLAASTTVLNKMAYSPFLKIDQAINPWFLGFNIAISPKQSGQLIYLLIPLVTAVLQYFQATAMTMPVSQPKKSEDGKQAKKNDSEDFQKAMNTQMKFLFPVMIGWFSYTLPFGLSLYWNIFSLFSIIQGRELKAKSQITNNK